MGIISSEMHYGWSSPALPVLISGDDKLRITSEEGSWLVVALLVGTITGAILTGHLADVLGRKLIILCSLVPIVVGWAFIYFATSVAYLFVARTIAGVSVGMSLSVVPMYLGEIAEPKLRGLLASLCPVSLVLGILFINILGGYMSISNSALAATVIPVIMAFTFVWMPESPTYLLIKGKTEEARQSMEKLQGRDVTQEELLKISDRVKLEFEDKKKGSKVLFSDRVNRKSLIIVLGLRTVQQLCGTSIITFYCKTIFEETKEFISPNISSIVYFTIQMIVALISSLIVDFTGRRILLFISIAGSGITLLTTGVCLHLKNVYNFDNISYIPIVSLFFYVIVFNIGVRCIPLLMVGEMFSPSVKSAAVSLTAIYFSVFSIIVAKFFHYTKEFLGLHVSFYTFSLFSFLSLIFVYHFVPETKGKSLEQIQDELREKDSANDKLEKPSSIKFVSDVS